MMTLHQSFINSLEAQTQPNSQVEPEGAEQGVQRESCHVSIDTRPQVHHFRDDSESRSHCTHDGDDSDDMVYISFNLQNINAPVPPKWKHNDQILEEYMKFCHSCQRIFDGSMAHTTSGKVITNMFFIQCGPDGEDIYDNFQLTDDEMYDTDYVIKQFELYCEPIFNFMLPDISSVKCLKERMK